MSGKRALLLVLGGLLVVSSSTSFGQRSALRAARVVADRVIRETELSLRQVKQKPFPGLQIIDFSRLSDLDSLSTVYAVSNIISGRDTAVSFGISHDCPLRVWVNGRTAYERSSVKPLFFREVGYDLYLFSDTMAIPLKRGENRVLLKGVLSAPQNQVYLKELTAPRKEPAVKFTPCSDIVSRDGAFPWLIAGPFIAQNDPFGGQFPADGPLGPNHGLPGDSSLWKSVPAPLMSEYVIKRDAVFQKESCAEWTYPNGTVLLSLLELSRTTGDTSYEKFVREVCGFTLSNLKTLEHEYAVHHARRCANYRIFRRCMLDDTGAPVLPYAELVPQMNDERLRLLVDTMAAYVSSGQVRLADGTLCRYEPEAFTIWADDLFMSVPFLLRLGNLSGRGEYFDDASKQIVNFNRYLVDQKTGLYRHGYYESRKEQSPVCWGRANGWVAWAHSEALLHLPKTHPAYRAIAELFRRHMKALISVQDRSGLWHQVLDRPDSYEETSSTAMFMIGLARGVRLGILEKSCLAPLRKAWAGLQTRISEDGIVKDICRGTEIGNDPSFYFVRERFDNDPRGLGAVITALVEAESLLK